MKQTLLIFVLSLVFGCTTKVIKPVTSVPDNFKIVSKEAESQLGYSLDEYYLFQVRNKIQVVGNGVNITGVLDYEKGMTVMEAIDRSGGPKDCFDLDIVGVKRADLGYLLILDAPLTGQLLAGDSVYVNCAR